MYICTCVCVFVCVCACVCVCVCVCTRKVMHPEHESKFVDGIASWAMKCYCAAPEGEREQREGKGRVVHN